MDELAVRIASRTRPCRPYVKPPHDKLKGIDRFAVGLDTSWVVISPFSTLAEPIAGTDYRRPGHNRHPRVVPRHFDRRSCVARICYVRIVDDDYDVRYAAPEEAGDVARLLHDFNTEFDTPSPGVEVLQVRLDSLLRSPDTLAILAGHPAIAMALVTLRTNVWYSGPVALLDELYVAPELRNRGIGTAIMQMLHSFAHQNGVGLIEINVDVGDTDARRFYERHGYSAIEPTTNEHALYYSQEL